MAKQNVVNGDAIHLVLGLRGGAGFDPLAPASPMIQQGIDDFFTTERSSLTRSLQRPDLSKLLNETQEASILWSTTKDWLSFESLSKITSTTLSAFRRSIVFCLCARES